MSYGPKQVFTVAIASAASRSAALDLGDKSFTNWAIAPSNMGDVFNVYGCDTLAGTYKPVYQRINTSTAQYAALSIVTAVSGGWASIDTPPPFRYFKFQCATDVANGSTITVIAQD